MARLTNGGVVGKQVIPNVGSASGKWNISDSHIYIQTGSWPIDYVNVPSGLYARWDASVESSIIKTGNAVTQWNDLTANSINLTVNGSPTYQPTGLNGKPTMYLDGNDAFRTISSSISFGSPGLTIAMVADFTTNNIIIEHTADANNGSFYVYGATGNSIYYVTGAGGSAYNFSDASWGSSGGVSCFIYQYNGTNAGHFVRKNKTLLTGNNSQTSNPGFSNISSNLYIASRAGNSYFPTGVLSEIVIYKSVLSLNEIQNLENYLYSKWSIT